MVTRTIRNSGKCILNMYSVYFITYNTYSEINNRNNELYQGMFACIFAEPFNLLSYLGISEYRLYLHIIHGISDVPFGSGTFHFIHH